MSKRARRTAAVLSVAGLLLIPVPAAGGHGDHGSCAAFGDHVSTDATTLQPSGVLVSGFARAGSVDGHIASDHAGLCLAR